MNLPTHSQGPSERKPIKKFGEKGAWTYPGTAQIFEYPLLSQDRVKLRTSSLAHVFTWFMRTNSPWQVYSQGPCEQKPIKNLGEKGAYSIGVSKDYPNYLSTPYYLRNG